MKNFVVECEWDEDAQVWYVSNSTVPGLVAEAETADGMMELLRQRVIELLELNMPDVLRGKEREVPVDLTIKQHRRLAIAC